MPHLRDGLLRLMTDEPDVAPAPARAHLRSCPECQARLRAMDASAARIGRLLEAPEAVDVSAALARLAGRLERGASPSQALGARLREVLLGARHRRVTVALAVAALACLTVGMATGMGGQLAVLIAHPRQAVLVPVHPSELRGLQVLADYGTVSYSELPLERRVADAGAAEAAAGFPALTIAAPPAPAPGISPRLAREIGGLGDPAQTLPVLMLSNDSAPTPIQVQGVTGSLLAHSVENGTVIVWSKDGYLFAVFGSISQAELQAAAESAA